MTEILKTAKPAEDMTSFEGWKGRIGLFGKSKSGKTTSALTIPPYFRGEKKPRLLIDFDGRSQAAAGFKDVVVISVFDPDASKDMAWRKLDAIKKELWAAVRSEDPFPYSCIIEDGGTMMGRYAMNWALLLDPKRGLGGSPAQHHYGPQMKAFADHILSMKELPCHYIFCGHIELVENPSDGSVIYLPKVIGKTARTELSTWFDEIYYCRRAEGDDGVDYSWITQGTGKLDFFGSTLNQLGRYWKDPIPVDFKADKVGFADLLERRFGKKAEGKKEK